MGPLYYLQILPYSVPGCEGYSTIQINYTIPGGVQGKEHPNPGQRYGGTSRVAYLPDNLEGREVFQVLYRSLTHIPHLESIPVFLCYSCCGRLSRPGWYSRWAHLSLLELRMLWCGMTFITRPTSAEDSKWLHAVLVKRTGYGHAHTCHASLRIGLCMQD